VSNVSEDASVSFRRPHSPRWWRWTSDVVLVFALLLLNLVSVGPPNEARVDSTTFVLTTIIVLPLLVRRRWPVHVFFSVVGIAAAQYSLGRLLRPGDIAVLVALYTLYAYVGGRIADVGAVIVVAGLIAEFFQDPAAHGGGDLIAPAVVVTAVVVSGHTIRVRRTYLHALEDRATRLESERDALDRAAVAEERSRIAREMHDVVAHRVGVIVAQADGARYAFDAHPDQARAALDVIADNARSALSELRQLLGVLRANGSAAATAPQPGLPDIDTLIAEMRAAGLPVRLTTSGTAAGIEPAVGLALYRVVQESLTNTLKHAGPGTPVEVSVDHLPGQVHVTVADEGPDAIDDAHESGHGLIGMRERVSMLGGTFAAGRARPHGWRVDITVPVTAKVPGGVA
jgi:signal transduction histidine kinase